MKEQRRTRMMLALIPIIAVSACGELRGTADGVVVTDSAGIALVTYAGPDRPAPWILEESRVLTTADGAMSNVPWGVVAQPATGNVYVLDWMANRVFARDRSGELGREFGRPGGGPGEFRNPSALSLDENGALAVWDAGRGILSRWSSEGELLDERHVPVDYWGPGFHTGPAGILTVTASSTAEEIRQSLILLAPEGRSTLHEVSQTQVLMQLPCATMPAPRLFSPSIVWTALGDTAYVLNGRRYRVDVRVGNTLAASYRRATPPVRITEEMAVRSIELGPFSGFARQCGVTAEQLARAVGHEEVTAPVLWMTRDPAGRLWVSLTSNGLTPDRADILDPQGRYLGTLPMDAMPVAFLSEIEMVGLSVSEMGVTMLKLYELRPATEAADAGYANSPEPRSNR